MTIGVAALATVGAGYAGSIPATSTQSGARAGIIDRGMGADRPLPAALNEECHMQTPKIHLPLTYVMHASGHEPESYSGNDILYRVPWRTDSDPSLALYKSEDDGVVNKYRDLASGSTGQGDLFDLIASLHPEADTFPQQVTIAEDLLEAFQEDPTWTPPEPATKRATLDLEAYRAEQTERSLQHDSGTLDQWLSRRTDSLVNVPAAWLTSAFGVTWSAGQMHIPYFDADGELQSGKYRRPDEKVHSLPGSTFTFFYGEHLDTDPSKTVVVCEGEPDVWSGTYAAREDYVFLGLPTGAGYSEKLASRLVGRTVLLALDGDTAGREALVRWITGLQGIADSVAMILLPQGKDLGDMIDIPEALSRQIVPTIDLKAIIEVAGAYRQATKDGKGGKALSDFTMKVCRVMPDTLGALHFEVLINGKVHDLRSWDLRGKNSMRIWASARGHTWLGSDEAVAMLENHLKVQSQWVHRIKGVHDAGLHGAHFVWPGGIIGDDDLKWVPGPVEGFGAHDFHLRSAPMDRKHAERTLNMLVNINAPHSIHPILAWLAAAPLRSQVVQFPILNIAGSRGTGKTATIETIIPTWSGFDRYLGLGTAPTRFGMSSLVAGGNAFPVALDEYRPSGAKSGDDTLMYANDIIRATYNCQVRETGGYPGEPMRKIKLPMSSPLIVAGESTLDEPSLRERAILVRLQKEGLRPEVMSQFEALPQTGTFAHSWLRWLMNPDPTTQRGAAALTASKAGPESLPERPRYNLGILVQGWDLIHQFIEEYHLTVDIPDAPDLSAVVAEYLQAEVETPLAAALEAVYSMDRPRGGQSVVMVDDELRIKLELFCNHASDLGFNLSGSANAVGKQLAEGYGAFRERRHDDMGVRYRCWVLPADAIFRDDVD